MLGYYFIFAQYRICPLSMQKLLIILITGASLVLSACSSVSIPGAHKIDIQQGNVITQDMVDKLKPGMDKNQVRFALGTPPIVDVFHQERWDYVYSLQRGGKAREQRRVSLFFEDDKLARMEGDVVPSAGKREEQAPKETTVTVTPSDQKKNKKGFFSNLRRAIGLGREDDFAKSPDGAASPERAASPPGADSTDITPNSAEPVSP